MVSSATLVIAVVTAIALAAGVGIVLFRKSAAGRLRKVFIDRTEGRIDEAEFQQRLAALQAALKARTPADFSLWWAFLPAAIGVGVLAAYLNLKEPAISGSPAAAVPMAAAPAAAGAAAGRNAGDMGAMVKRLAEKLQKDPNNAEGWALLARARMEVRQYPEASEAFARAAALAPPDANLLADWAEATVTGQGGKWDAKAADMVQRALAADPKHLKALTLAGSEAFGRGNYQAAIRFWERVEAAAPADSKEARLAAANIGEARKGSSGKGP
jgi:cytochrome c-type biogenesis protein CcmH